MVINTGNTQVNDMESNKKTQLIDVDVHCFLGSLDELVPYSDEWLQKMMNFGKFSNRFLTSQTAGAFEFPKTRYHNPNHVLRLDATTPSGGVPGSDPAFVGTDLFDKFGTTYGILNVGHGTMAPYHNVDVTTAYSSACNDWLYDKWVNVDERFKIDMVVSTVDANATVKEIERIGKKPGVVGINLQNINIPLGKRHFWPIYEIAEAYGLPIVLHPDSEGSGEYSPPQYIGPASTYMEWHSSLSIVPMRQINSLICEGVFERFPKLKVVFVEYGFSWMPHLMWRLDKNWKALRDEIPWVKMLPSEYIRRNIRLATQPFEEPFHPKDLVTLVEMIDAEDMLMFSSDYPHWDGEHTMDIFAHFPDDLKHKIFYKNALETYRF
ncbi:amidohydrolase [Sporosarcina sp. P12(2017)]|uniref:amidohydrolase family protein n=1 Tax=unclassified Sporosarcina TaxID=2647733 RepID=UPI000C1632E2|nr:MULTISPECIES: amidohydrolase family protein [unclassified Sporosarcina]PIC58314.1 amidohydrolase [Sporosarcina sp. P10]PIC61521.1 amidohydrolase [Sporosarcina sp. P12(2017)]